MRVIGGVARGRKLWRVPGDSTRPVMDRVKENLFNIVQAEVDGSSWLDLFAGTGQVAIEALSRGASRAVFVDNNRLAIRTVRRNLEHTGLVAASRLVMADAFSFLTAYDGLPFDFIYIAPPQYQDLWQRALLMVDAAAASLLSQSGAAIVQIDPKEYAELDLANLTLADSRRYGNTQLLFLRRQGRAP